MKNKKKYLLLPVIILALCLPLFALTGCGSFSVGRNAPSFEQLLGNWELTETRYRGGFDFGSTYRPGTTTWPGWAGGYFIYFAYDGTFAEQNFWNFDLTTLTGTFSIEGSSLTLSTTGRQGAFVFVGNREVSISDDGDTLTMVYTRVQDGTWHYRHIFARTGGGPPPQIDPPSGM
ncbi:MAG: hypothetical protein FWC82_00785 [Firmicutes bacterium]|nr:hypothetical protein [Bacillota bacterium]